MLPVACLRHSKTKKKKHIYELNQEKTRKQGVETFIFVYVHVYIMKEKYSSFRNIPSTYNDKQRETQINDGSTQNMINVLFLLYGRIFD